MIELERLKERLALHGYYVGEEVNIFENGLTYICRKDTDKDKFHLSFYADNQMGDKFWTFSLSKCVDFYPKKLHAHPILFLDIHNIEEEDLTLLPVFEKRLADIDASSLE